MRISKSVADGVRPAKKDTYLWDSHLRGFGLKTTPTGHKTYIIQYRLGGRNGRTRRFTIGTHGRITADQARKEAKRLLGEVSAGRDPMSARDEQRRCKPLYEVLDEFLAQHVAINLKPRSQEHYSRSIRFHIKPTLRNVPITEVDRAQIAHLHHQLNKTPYEANRTLAVLSKFFNWCEAVGYRNDGSNPCKHISKYKEHRRERFLSAAELARLGEAISKAETQGLANEKGWVWHPSPHVIAAVRLLIMTGARLSEVLTLKWEFVDFEKMQARLPDSKTGAKTLYLNAPAMSVLAEVPRLQGNPYVICGDGGTGRLINLQKPWRKIRGEAGLEDVRIHDLRHTFASFAVAQGMSLPMIGKLLGHSQPATTARYAHLSNDPAQQASEETSRALSLHFYPEKQKNE